MLVTVVPPRGPLAESNQCHDPTDQWKELGGDRDGDGLQRQTRDQ
jgi:hypothetical protein